MTTTANITTITRLRARTAGVAVGLLALAAIVAAFALPSAASAREPRCPTGAFCMWMHSGYHGPKYVAFGSRRVLDGAKYRGTNISVAESGSSFLNNARRGARKSAVRLFYLGFPGSDSPSLCIERGQKALNLDFWPIRGLDGIAWNDNIAGLTWVTHC